MPKYSHLTSEERDRIAELKAAGTGVQAIARTLGRAASSVSRELSRNALPSGAYRPVHADGCYRFRRQRQAVLETDADLRAFVVDRLAEGWTPEQIAGWLGRCGERGLRAISFETIYAFIFRAAQKTERLWRYLVRGRASRGRCRARNSQDRIREKVHVSQRSEAATAPAGSRALGGRSDHLQARPAGAGAA
jgi:transposase, IS30 family